MACPVGNVMTLSTGDLSFFPCTIEVFRDVVPIIEDILECYVFPLYISLADLVY